MNDELLKEERVVRTPRGDVRVRRAGAGDVVDLRHAILRAGLPRETAVFENDDNPESRHVVAVDADGRTVGCATFHFTTWDGGPAWQLRGMATDPAFRGTGLGKAMLAFAESGLRAETPVRQLWCNARVPAIGFYERLGWHVVSEPFEVPTAGPHVKMTKSLPE